MEPKVHFLLLLRYLEKTTTKTANTQTGSDLNNYSSNNGREDDKKGIKGPELFVFKNPEKNRNFPNGTRFLKWWMTVMVEKGFCVLFCSSLCAPEALNLTVYVPLFMISFGKPLNLWFSVRNNQPRLQGADSHDSPVNTIMFVTVAPITVWFSSAIYLPRLKSN